MTPPQIRVNSLEKGQRVHAFHRYCQDPHGNFFMVTHKSMGSLHPSIGKTDGWTEGIVMEDWSRNNYEPMKQESWPCIKWTHRLWYDRRGRMLDVSHENHVTQRIPAEQIRTQDNPEEARSRPLLSILSVRWGGTQPVDPVTEGVGGWGNIGSTCSDNYINGLESSIFNNIGCNYEIISCFIQNTSELAKLQSPLIKMQLRGKACGANYYLWPIGFDDGHDYPGYVERESLLALMAYNECSGIPTRFPHNTHLYKFFASKEWTAANGLNPSLNTPLTTKVSRSLIAENSEVAARTALEALHAMSRARASWPGFDHSKYTGEPIMKGVAKLGWSWEALDVRKWNNPQDLQRILVELAEQTGSRMEFVFVQEWVDFDIEIRNYVVLPQLNDRQSCYPRHVICTQFQEETAHGGFTNFNRFGREECLNQIFRGDKAAYQNCESQMHDLIYRWLHYFRSESSEMPVFCRFDMLVKYDAQGSAKVTTGELTELGGCFLGWEDGPRTVFSAILMSYFGAHLGAQLPPQLQGLGLGPNPLLNQPISHMRIQTYDPNANANANANNQQQQGQQGQGGQQQDQQQQDGQQNCGENVQKDINLANGGDQFDANKKNKGSEAA